MKRKRRVQWYHILFVIVAAVCFVIILSAKTEIFSKEEDTYSDSVKFNFKNFTPYQDTITMGVWYNMTFDVLNTAEVPVDCILELTTQNESYKNVTRIDIDVLSPEEQREHTIQFVMATGNTTLELGAIC